jgi:hypothetical protein
MTAVEVQEPFFHPVPMLGQAHGEECASPPVNSLKMPVSH